MADKFLISQNPRSNIQLFLGINRQIKESQQLQKIHFLNIMLAVSTWRNLGEALSSNPTVKEFRANASNIAEEDNIKVFMEEMH